ncbi:MAG TPA: hypothetical protein VGW40_05780 [Allosphingosinicella sp.]|nr:hypothetical protein [Allosphingosinicella sp.]
MIRAFDPTVHNRIANDPSVFPYIVPAMGGDLFAGPVDFTECAARPDDYVLVHNGKFEGDPEADAAMIFEWRAPDVWEMHTMFLPSCRGGTKSLNQATEFVEYMFANGAEIVWGVVAIGNERARAFFLKAGGKSKRFKDHHILGPVEEFSVTKSQWATLRR